MTQVILVDQDDREVGLADKLEAHRTGRLHRAVSVFAFDPKGRLLLQRRAPGKYHSGGLWSNSACTHPTPGESPEAAAHRCLHEEMAVTADLEKAFTFTYRSPVVPGLIEHELDHVFIGTYSGVPRPAPEEVSEWRLDQLDRVIAATRTSRDEWTPWCALLAEPVQRFLQDR
jgi:isopentenyl-diphosphate Delta-isomerase